MESKAVIITIIVCVTLLLAAIVGALAAVGAAANAQHVQLIRTCVNDGGQWINGSCVRGGSR